VDELTSLLDLSVPLPGPLLPAGHPFSPAQVFYWSATVDQGDSGQALSVSLLIGFIGPVNGRGKSNPAGA